MSANIRERDNILCFPSGKTLLLWTVHLPGKCIVHKCFHWTVNDLTILLSPVSIKHAVSYGNPS